MINENEDTSVVNSSVLSSRALALIIKTIAI